MYLELNDDELNCQAYKTHYLDLYKSMSFLKKEGKFNNTVLVHYLYCEESDCFIILCGADFKIKSGILLKDSTVLNASIFKNLYDQYERAFLKIDNTISIQAFKEIKDTWTLFHELLVKPLLDEYDKAHFYVLFDHTLNNKKTIIDFNNLFNLRYRFHLIGQNEEIQFTTVTTESIFNFLKNITNLPYPEPSNSVLLYGLMNDIKKILGSNISEELKERAREREKLFTKVFEAIKANNGEVILLNNIDDLCNLFYKGKEQKVIHLISHFHNGRLFTCTDQSISYRNILNKLKRLREMNRIREDIIIDAVTCFNFDSFKDLYSNGIKYVYMSHHNLSTDLAGYILFELYTGKNAYRLKWKYPYLDGKTYLHEALSNVNRCFYTITNMGGDIEMF